MSDFFSFNYFCEQSRKILKHVIIYCVKYSETHKKLKINK